MKTAIYVRVSTTEQASEGYSLDAQLERCKAYALSQGWEVVETYIEEGESAKDLNRTKLKQLISDAQNGEFEVLLVYRLDRLTRSVSDLYKLLDMLDKYGIKFKSASELYDTTSSMGKLFITLVAALAEWELNNLRERVRFGMEQLVKEGKWHGGPIPYGYNWNGETMVVVPEEASIIRELRRLYMAGNGYGATAKQLNSLGLKRRDGLPWSQNSVEYTLESPFYAGKIRYGTKKKNGKYAGKKKEDLVNVIWSDTSFPTIFTWAEYEEQKERMRRRQFYGTSKKREYWFSGVIRCARCGSAMMGRPYRNKKVDGTVTDGIVNYICSNRSSSRGCTMPMLRQSVAEKMILEYVRSIKVTQEEIAAAGEVMQGEVISRESELEKLQKELRTIADRRKKWQYMFAEDLISEVDFRERKRDDDQQELVILSHIEEIKASEIGIHTNYVSALLDLPARWGSLDDGEKKEGMQTLFESVYFECDVNNGREFAKKGQTLPFRITEVNFN